MKKLKQLLTVGLLLIAGVINAQMVLEYDIATANTEIALPLAGAVNVTVDWGDGSTEPFTADGDIEHTYATTGVKTVTISGSLTAYGGLVSYLEPNDRLVRVLSWDGLGLTSLEAAFSRAENLIQVPNTLPSGVTNLDFMFTSAIKFNQPLASWDVSNVTSMRSMFHGADKFNQPLNTWDVSNVTDMYRMFYSANDFNQSISSWDVSNVTNMGSMFYAAVDFNQPLDLWDVSNVTNMHRMFYSAHDFNQSLNSWDVSNVTDMSQMFNLTRDFNQPLDLWDVSSVTDMEGMFYLADDFNQSLGSWDISNVTKMTNMFYGVTLCTEHYDQTLNGWATRTVNSGISFHGGDSKYSIASIASRAILTNSWTITDGGEDTDGSGLCEPRGMILEYDIVTPNTIIALPLAGSVDVTVAWGDGASQDFTSASNKEHTYTTTGVKIVTISGSLSAFGSVSIGTGNARLTKVISWEDDLGLTSLNNAFRSASILTEVPSNLPVDVTNLFATFFRASIFNDPIDSWDVSGVTNMSYTFSSAKSFNQSLASWNVGSVTTMKDLFSYASVFDQSLNTWNVSNVTNMSRMFVRTVFNQPLGAWDVSSVTNMESMFTFATEFDQNIDTWNVSNVTSMFRMFQNTPFDKSLDSWDVSSVTDMRWLFMNATAFNKSLESWDVSNVPNMEKMFRNASSFNQPLDAWDVGNVTDMEEMFQDATAFNQPLGSWGIDQVTNMTNMFLNVTLCTEHYDETLNGWAPQIVNSGISFNGGNSKYSAAGVDSRATLESNWGMTITDGGEDTDGSGFCGSQGMVLEYDIVTPNTTIVLPLRGTVDVTVDWGDGSTDSYTYIGNKSHTYSTVGTKTVVISGTLTEYGAAVSNERLTKVISWGDDLGLTSLYGAFFNASILEEVPSNLPMGVTNLFSTFSGATIFNDPIDSWDVSNVTNMSLMFYNAISFDQTLASWDVGNAVNMERMFLNASSFNKPLDSWDVSNVTNMREMFREASSFNQTLGLWDVSNVTIMSLMFDVASSFNQPLSSWDVGNVVYMERMFQNATSFNQPLGIWDISNVTTMNGMFDGATLCTDHYDATLNGWASQTVNSGIIFHGGNSKYSAVGAASRAILESNWGNTIIDGGLTTTPTDCSDIIRAGELDSETNTTADLITLFPNPAESVLQIDWNITTDGTAYIDIFSSNGVLVSENQVDVASGSFLDVSDLDEGVYMMNITTEGNTFVKRFVKQ